MTRSMSSGLRPQLETLECRTVPASWSTSDGVLTITGYGGDNVIRIYDNGDGDLAVYLDGDWLPASRLQNLRQINIDTQGGDDQVDYYQEGYFHDRTNDMVLDVDLGSGNDRFFARINGDILWGETLKIMVDGQTGHDTITVDADNDVDIKAGATLKLELDGGSGDDVIMTSYEGELDGHFGADYNLGYGKDKLYSWVTRNSGSSGTSWRTWSHVGDNDYIYISPVKYGSNVWDPI